ncbi:MAG: hypothetical protein V1725_04270 [archaeon]
MNATITIDDPHGSIAKSFAAEDKNIGNRATYAVLHDATKTIFTIQAQDSVALRTTCNAITKLLTLHEQLSEHGKRHPTTPSD